VTATGPEREGERIMETTSIETMAERLNRIEQVNRDQKTFTERVVKQNRLMRRVGAIVMLGGAALVIAGANRADVPKEVAAEQFVVRDRDGKERAKLFLSEDGSPMLGMKDRFGKSDTPR